MKIVKRMIRLLAAAAILCMLCIPAFAAEARTVYVADGGTGTGASASAPCGSLDAAVALLEGKGGRIVLCGDTTVKKKTQIPAQSGKLEITSAGGRLILAMRLQFLPAPAPYDIVIDTPISITKYTYYIFGGYNNVTFTENCKTTLKDGGKLGFFGGTMPEADFSTPEADLISTHPYSVTVNEGDFAYFGGGNFRNVSQTMLGSLAAPVSVTINGGHFGTGSYGAAGSNRSYEAFSLSGNSVLAAGGSLTIRGGVFDCPVYLQGRYYSIADRPVRTSTLFAADADLQTADGDITLTIDGGSFAGYEIAAAQVTPEYTFLLRGNLDVHIGAGAVFADGTVLDATQVKARAGENRAAALTAESGVRLPVCKRFDFINGKAQTADEPLRILCIGDSITWGTGSSAPATRSYPAQLLALLDAAGRETVITDCGVPATGVLASANTCYPNTFTCSMAYQNTDPDYIIFSLGINDARTAGGTNGALLSYTEDYTALIEKFAALPSVKKVFITSALPMHTVSASDAVSLRGVTVIRQTQRHIAETLAAGDADKFTYIDLYALLFPEAMADIENGMKNFFCATDNLHPSDAGYVVYAKCMYDAIFGGVCTREGFDMSDVYISAAGSMRGAGTKNDPISSLPVAFARLGSGGTLHVVGEFASAMKVFTPLYTDGLTFVGEGTGAVLKLTGGLFKAGSAVTFDNITLDAGSASDLFACYNDVTFTETAKTKGTWNLKIGYNLYADRAATKPSDTLYDTVASASADKDCRITLLGGRFSQLYGGNRMFATNAPYGTYSGRLTIRIGSGATVGSRTTISALCGQNYLTGSVDAEMDAYLADGILLDFAPAGADGFDPTANTGSVRAAFADGVTPAYTPLGDFDGDGKANVRDVLFALRAVVGGDAINGNAYYGLTKIELRDVVCLLRTIAK